MQLTKDFFEKTGKDKGVYLFSLQNDKGACVKITNYGACVTSIVVPDKNGKFDDVVLGFDNLEQYLVDHPFFGVTCGRYANRIANGNFNLNGVTYKLAINNAPNTLHGGIKGFDKVVWNATPVENKDSIGVKMEYFSKDMEEGYPGNLSVEVTFMFNNNNELSIDYVAKTDKSTVINLTNHSYFNLNGCKSEMLDHTLTIHADKITPVDKTSIPTGEINNVSGTAYDFLKPKKIGADFSKLDNGYDHNYIINKKSLTEYSYTAKAIEPVSGRNMEVYTTEPGVQLYTGNYLDGSVVGKNGISYKKHYGFCLETQHYPDSPNHSIFPTTILNPGEVYTQKTAYKFGIEK